MVLRLIKSATKTVCMCLLCRNFIFCGHFRVPTKTDSSKWSSHKLSFLLNYLCIERDSVSNYHTPSRLDMTEIEFANCSEQTKRITNRNVICHFEQLFVKDIDQLEKMHPSSLNHSKLNLLLAEFRLVL